MISILFFIISGVCAPFDSTDCDYTLDFSEKSLGNTRGYYDFAYTITLNTFHPRYHEKDCWGLYTWEHEWLHAEIGYWHLAGLDPVCCMFRNIEFQNKFDNSWMVKNSGRS